MPTFSMELVTSLPVPQINAALAFCVLLAKPSTLLATPLYLLSLVADSMLFIEP